MDNKSLEKLEKNTAILKEKIAALLEKPSVVRTIIKGFTIAYRDKVNEAERCFFKPMTVSLLSGRKHSILGSEDIVYGANQTMVSGIDMPSTTQVIEASPEKPYFALILELDSVLIMELLKEVKNQHSHEATNRSVAITDSDPYVIEAYIRLVDLLSQPEDQQKVLAPMIIREIHYRLLTGPLGGILKMINTSGTQGNQIAKAVSWIKDNFKENFKIEELASEVNMAPSSFYRNFNKVTSLSPIQYQKFLRLQEAQRLMLTGEDAARAGYAVGYESPTQFSREYKKMFGNPPKTNIRSLKAV